MNEDRIAAELIALEGQRCAAMMAGDFDRLRELLHPGLVHVHAKGQVDDYESYFRSGGVKVDYRRAERSDLTVLLTGTDSALMTGRQVMEAVRKDGSGTVRIDSRVMQVWVRKDGGWRQLAFQTTPTDMHVG